MDKASILELIKRTAEENGGAPLSQKQFQKLTGVTERQWQQYWRRFTLAQAEAGYIPTELTKGRTKEQLLEMYANLALEIGTLPTKDDLRHKHYNGGGNFPSRTVFDRRFGAKRELVAQLLESCRHKEEFRSLIPMCEEYLGQEKNNSVEPIADESEDGYVYLGKSGKYYKIGKTNSVGRREYEIGLQMPEQYSIVHEIRTDDPSGIEAYWHGRFAVKRLNGEWFNLNQVDIAAFKRRKFFM